MKEKYIKAGTGPGMILTRSDRQRAENWKGGNLKIITVTVQKGGTGKTTTAAVLTQAAAYRGKKVLAVDLDPQGNFSFALAANRELPGTLDLLTGTPAEKVIQTTPQGIEAIAARLDLATLTTSKGSARRLQRALAPIKDNYDLIIIDTPTQPGELLYNAIQAATDIVIPLQSDIYTMESLFQTVKTVQAFTDSNPEMRIAGVIFNRQKDYVTLTRQMKETIEEYTANLKIPFLGTVRDGIAVQEAAFMQVSLYQYSKRSNPARDFLQIYDALEAQEQ